MAQDTVWQIVVYLMAVVFPAVLLYEMYRSIKHRITRGMWPKRKHDWMADEMDRDWQRMMDEANPAIPGTPAYESAFAREVSQDMEDAYRNMNPL